MPVPPTYPGVYIEEIPSGVRTITGVATSITAFIGRALRGPVNEATTINSYADFERIFGGLWKESMLGYAVQDFYLNGGSQAVIVRLYHPYFANKVDQQAANEAAKAVFAAAAGVTIQEIPNDVIAAAQSKVPAELPDTDPKKKAAQAVLDAAVNAKDTMPPSVITPAEQAQLVREAAKDTAKAAQDVADAATGKTPDEVIAAAQSKVPAELPDTDPKKKAAQAVLDAAVNAKATMPPSVITLAEQAQLVREAAKDTAKAAQDVANETALVIPRKMIAAAKNKVPEDLPETDPKKKAAQAVLDAIQTAKDSIPSTLLTDPAKQAQFVKAAANGAVRRTVTKAQLRVNTLILEAASEGAWGNKLRAYVDTDVAPEVATSFGLYPTDLFNLTISNESTNEQFRNVTVKDSPRRVDKVLETGSTLVRAVTFDPSVCPTPRAAQLLEAAKGTSQTALEAKKPLKQDPFILGFGVDDADQTEDGDFLAAVDFTPEGGEDLKLGLYALEKVDLFNLLCIPPYQNTTSDGGDIELPLLAAAASYCFKRRAFLIVDSRSDWNTKAKAVAGIQAIAQQVGSSGANAAIFFPRIRKANAWHDNRIETFVSCGAIAGIFARTDVQRGVWKAPAGLDATVAGIYGLSVPLSDGENGELNPLGVNCLRTFPAVGTVIWGARTLRGDDRLASEWKYIPVRRLALFIEESLYRGTQWVVFEPNDEPLWSQIRLNIGVFMHNLFRQGAFQGKSPREAYFVKCDNETTTQADIDLGIVNIVVGFAPLKPAEFVIIKLQQIAGQLEV